VPSLKVLIEIDENLCRVKEIRVMFVRGMVVACIELGGGTQGEHAQVFVVNNLELFRAHN